MLDMNMIFGEGDSSPEIHGTQLRIASDKLLRGPDSQIAREAWAIKYGERLLADLLRINSIQTEDVYRSDYTEIADSDGSTL